MRFRTFMDLSYPGDYYVRTVRKDGTVTRDSHFGTAPRYFKESMLDVVVPNYRRLSAMGLVFNNPMSRYASSSDGGMGTRVANATDGSQSSTAQGNIINFLTEFDGVSDLPNLVNKSEGDALLSAWANVDSTSYDFGEDLAELRESIEYLKKPLNSFYQLLKPYRRRRDSLVRKGLTKAKAHSKAWLEFRFGLAPMARSAYNAGDALANWTREVRPVRRTARGTYKSTYTKTDTITSGYRTYARSIDASCTTRATVLYEQPGGKLSIAANLGLRAKNIPSTMWAVCPYSWLIDRFVAINKLVGAYVNLFDPSIRYLLACQTQTIESTATMMITGDTTPGQSIGHSCTPRVTKAYTKYRNPAPTNDVPLPKFNTRSLASIVNLTDLMALILQRLR